MWRFLAAATSSLSLYLQRLHGPVVARWRFEEEIEIACEQRAVGDHCTDCRSVATPAVFGCMSPLFVVSKSRWVGEQISWCVVYIVYFLAGSLRVTRANRCLFRKVRSLPVVIPGTGG